MRKKRFVRAMPMCLVLAFVTGGQSRGQVTGGVSRPIAPLGVHSVVAETQGGSNYIYFGLNGCDRTGFSVVPSYRTHRELIDRQLLDMYQNGQRRLRIALPLSPSNGQESASTGTISTDYRQGIADFLASVRRVGFEEVMVVVGDGSMPPARWREWNEPAYQERWIQIVEFRKILVASGIRYRIDLLNEGMPAKNQAMLIKYTQRLWRDYSEKFGTTDTVGFSIIPDIGQDRFGQIPLVYGSNPPAILDLHFYAEAGAAFENAHGRLKELGYGALPWIVGESFYNDEMEAKEIRDAIARSGQRVRFLLQWPLTSAKRCADVDVPFPALFNNYRAVGF